MQKRRFGNSDIQVTPLAFGGNVFGWTVDESTSFRLLDEFVARGGNLIDTADIYSAWAPGNSGGESETIIGRWLERSGKRDSVVIATKVGMELAPDKKGLSKHYILRAVEDSLRRLRIETIDIYQSHKDDPETPLEETLEAYGELVSSGKVRVIGASNYDAERLARSLEISAERGLPRYASLQPQYNLYDRAELESSLAPLCREENIAVIPYYPLAAGFLTGKYRSEADLSKSARGESIGRKYMNERGLRILGGLDRVAERTGASLARISLAWVMAQPGITAPIASATSVEQLDELFGALDLTLDAESLRILDEASRP